MLGHDEVRNKSGRHRKRRSPGWLGDHEGGLMLASLLLSGHLSQDSRGLYVPLHRVTPRHVTSHGLHDDVCIR